MSHEPKRIFVTGGRGRLASLMTDHFRAPAYQVTLFSRHSSPGFLPLAQLHSPDGLRQADVIFHLAWSSLPATSEKDHGIEERNDLPLLNGILAAITDLPTEQRPHLVFFSSGGAVYGDALGRHSREDDTCQPIGNYGREKLTTEQLITKHATIASLPYSILRISNPYGYPVPKSRVQGLIPHALRCAAEGELLTIWGDGSAKKDFLYYTDFLSALEPIVAQRLTGIYNICSGHSHTVTEVIQAVESEIGKSIALEYKPAPKWDVHDSRLDPNRLISASGWTPQVSLSEGIRRAASGYATH